MIDYPKSNVFCFKNQKNIITLDNVPGFELVIPSQCLTDDMEIKVSLHYTDPPYSYGTNDFILLTPIVRLQPDGMHFPNHVKPHIKLPVLKEAKPYMQSINTSFDTCNKILIYRNSLLSPWEIEQCSFTVCHHNGYQCIAFSLNHYSDGAVATKKCEGEQTATSGNVISRDGNLINNVKKQQEIKVEAYTLLCDEEVAFIRLLIMEKSMDSGALNHLGTNGELKLMAMIEGCQQLILSNGSYKIRFLSSDGKENLRNRNKNSNESLDGFGTINWNEKLYYEGVTRLQVPKFFENLKKSSIAPYRTICQFDIYESDSCNTSNIEIQLHGSLVLNAEYLRKRCKYCIVSTVSKFCIDV